MTKQIGMGANLIIVQQGEYLKNKIPSSLIFYFKKLKNILSYVWT